MRNRFAPLENTQDEVLDKEAKNYKEKDTSQHCHQTPVYRKQNHQPNLIFFGNKEEYQRIVNIVTVWNGKKTFIVCTSMVKAIRIKEVNSQLWNSYAKLRSFPGGTLKHLRYYIVSSLIDETPGRIILHGGCDDVNNKNSTPEKIANEIEDMVILCRYYDVNDVFILAIICRRGKFLNTR